MLFYAFKRKAFEVLNQPMIKKFIEGFFNYLCAENPLLLSSLSKRKELTEDIKSGLDKTFVSFFKSMEEEAKK